MWVGGYFPVADIERLEVGVSASYSQTITEADVVIFAGVSGDKNPVHVNEECAAQSRYKRRIAHGLISASFFSVLLGTKLPGSGCVYAFQNPVFKRAVYIQDQDGHRRRGRGFYPLTYGCEAEC